ncbi:hypothetical protein [Haloarchaeobius sp. HRN-SO-5]|uniref:hypothetical protein n=1 Tax=Haloarchaeobius sp. HRN-SO-5 TaxID=3446118 RepID=UPI003EB8CDAF
MAAYNGRLVDWVLDTIAENWNSDTYSPRLVDRDDSQEFAITTTGTAVVGDATVGQTDAGHELLGDLTTANYVGVSSADRTTEVSGWEYDEDVDAVVPIRIEGYSGGWGHVDDHADFRALTREVERTLKVERQWPIRPDPDRDGEYYHRLEFRNQVDQSSNWSDYCRYDADIVLFGHIDLP